MGNSIDALLDKVRVTSLTVSVKIRIGQGNEVFLSETVEVPSDMGRDEVELIKYSKYLKLNKQVFTSARMTGAMDDEAFEDSMNSLKRLENNIMKRLNTIYGGSDGGE